MAGRVKRIGAAADKFSLALEQGCRMIGANRGNYEIINKQPRGFRVRA